MAGRVGSKVCTYCVLGWSDFLLLLFSKMGTLLPIGYIFMSSITKSLKILPRAAHERQSFHFQKITETFKMNFILENLQISIFLLLQRTIAKKEHLKFFYIFYFRLPNWAKLFFTWPKEKQSIFEFLFIFSF